jgi:hypothetical protein
VKRTCPQISFFLSLPPTAWSSSPLPPLSSSAPYNPSTSDLPSVPVQGSSIRNSTRRLLKQRPIRSCLPTTAPSAPTPTMSRASCLRLDQCLWQVQAIPSPLDAWDWAGWAAGSSTSTIIQGCKVGRLCLRRCQWDTLSRFSCSSMPCIDSL